MTAHEEYLICKYRGHEADTMKGTVSTASYGALSFSYCKYCGTEFAYTRPQPELLERNVPVAPKEANNNE